MIDEFDRLSLDNENLSEESIGISINEPKQEISEVKTSKPHVFGAVLATIKRDNSVLYPAEGAVLPNLKHSLLTFFGLFVLAAVLIIVYSIITHLSFIPILLLFVAFAAPLLLLVFYHEFNYSNNVYVHRMVILFILGAVIYLIFSHLGDNFIATLFYQSIVDSIITPIALSMFIFIAIFLFASYFKVSAVSECFIIGVSIAMGYAACEILTNGFEALFIPTKIGTDLPYETEVIINQEAFLENSIKNLFDNWAYEYLLMPYLYACWATIISHLVFMLIGSRREKNEMPRSMYLLIMLVIVLHVIAVVDTSLGIFNVALRIVSLLASTFLLFKILNSSLNKEEDLSLEF